MFNTLYENNLDNKRAVDFGQLSSVVPKDRLPPGFDLSVWNEQLSKYSLYDYFWSGKVFEETTGKDPKTGKPVLKYPLKINTLHTVSRIHNAMLWGETRDHDQVLRTRVKPRPSFATGKPDEKRKDLAKVMERVLDRVWDQSHGAALLRTGGKISQYMGGYYLKVDYHPERTDTPIPFFIRGIQPEFVLPVPNPDNPWELLECFIIYRINSHSARAMYGIEPSNSLWVPYIQHYTVNHMSVLVDGKPVTETRTINGVEVKRVLDKCPHPFGTVPVFYVPRLREKGFFGTALTEAIMGLMTEYNSRMADAGDQVAENADAEWFATNLDKDPVKRAFGNGRLLNDLGKSNPILKTEPKVWVESPGAIAKDTLTFNNTLLATTDRESGVSPVAHGIDEGSQRSGATLEIRMFPTISQAREQRTNWDTAIGLAERFILNALAVHAIEIPGHGKLQFEDISEMQIKHTWSSYIPRDGEALTNEIVQLTSTGNMSLERSVNTQPGVEDPEEEIEMIKAEAEEKQRQAMEQAQAKSQFGSTQDGAKKPSASEKQKSKSEEKSSD